MTAIRAICEITAICAPDSWLGRPKNHKAVQGCANFCAKDGGEFPKTAALLSKYCSLAAFQRQKKPLAMERIATLSCPGEKINRSRIDHRFRLLAHIGAKLSICAQTVPPGFQTGMNEVDYRWWFISGEGGIYLACACPV